MQNLIYKNFCIIKVPSEMKARVVIIYDEPQAVLSTRSAKLLKNLSLIVWDLTEKILSTLRGKANKRLQRSKHHLR